MLQAQLKLNFQTDYILRGGFRRFTGEQCEIDINECDSEPCLNGGNCSQDRAPNQYECQCPLGWTGANCESGL